MTNTTKLIMIMACLFFAQSAWAESKPLKTDKDKFSYTVGFQFASSLKQQGVDVDPKIVSQALQDVMAGKKPVLSMEQMQAALKAYQEKLMAERNAMGEKAKKAGAEFLAANKKKKGVKVLDSGIQYKVLTAGKGKKPTKTDTVVAHYKGTLIDGKVFDSSYERKQPMTFGLSGVIPGWQEIIPLMPVGSKWTVYIPSDMAYGPRGTPGGPIGPNETLIFDIELMEIKK